jgi:hypothetical protein
VPHFLRGDAPGAFGVYVGRVLMPLSSGVIQSDEILL